MISVGGKYLCSIEIHTLLTDIQSGVEVVCGQRKELELEFWEERVVEALEGDIHFYHVAGRP